jgi:hypothetical protein
MGRLGRALKPRWVSRAWKCAIRSDQAPRSARHPRLLAGAESKRKKGTRGRRRGGEASGKRGREDPPSHPLPPSPPTRSAPPRHSADTLWLHCGFRAHCASGTPRALSRLSFRGPEIHTFSQARFPDDGRAPLSAEGRERREGGGGEGWETRIYLAGQGAISREIYTILLLPPPSPARERGRNFIFRDDM